MHISAKLETKPKYDFFAVLAKAVLLVLLVYGAIGGFLSTYQIQYNKTLCVVIISAVALYVSAIYELRRKWITNGLSFVLLGGFFLYASKLYWYLNSGYYAIVNRIFEDARLYLGIANRTEYAETIENQYSTVTYFVIFIGIVCVIFINIYLSNKIRLFGVVLLTFTPQLLPMYFEKTPDIGYLTCLLTGYLVVAILQGNRQKDRYGSKLVYLLPVIFVFILTCMQIFNVVFPKRVYQSYIPQNEQKELTEDAASNLFLYGAAAVFGGRGNAGIGGGMLNQVASVRPDYETDLIVRFTPYDTAPVYLKAFTSMRYDGSRWYHCFDGRGEEGIARLYREERLYDTSDTLRKNFANGDEYAAKGIMEITNVGATGDYDYYPYYTDFLASHEKSDVEVSGETSENTWVYTYYPNYGYISGVPGEVAEGYLEVPQICYDAVEEVCIDAGLGGTEVEIAEQIDTYFDENYKYTLRPGYSFGSRDYITRFLLSSKKGFCAHFASSATMLFRYMGIPARYVEGYVFSYNEITANGEMIEDAKYEDYFSGYSAIGETGLIELEIPDANAHAWVEIYVQDKGWIVVDPTPMADSEAEESFWDVFGDIGEDIIMDDGMATAGEYLEQVANSVAQVLAWVVVGLVLFFIGRKIYRWRKDAALTPKERVAKNYRLLIKTTERKRKEFVSYRTVKEQMEWIRVHYRVEEINDEFVEKLYVIFFAPETEEEQALLLATIKQIHKKVKRRKFTE